MAKELNCIFCKIIEGTIPSFKIYEDDDSIAILDIYPNIRGQTIVMPKNHMPSNVFEISDENISKLIKSAKKVVKTLEKKLNAERINLVFEGHNPHLHAKLYPAPGFSKHFDQNAVDEKVFFEAYPGYVTTLLGPRADDEELREVQKQITGK